MKTVHVECLPDETLVMALGVPRNKVRHHSGKSRVFSALKKCEDEIAIVDEDPGATKTSYEEGLQPVFNEGFLKILKDQNNNRIIILNVKLEDWLIQVCEAGNVDITNFSLPGRPNALHAVINSKLNDLKKLIVHLLKDSTSGVALLKKRLN